MQEGLFPERHSRDLVISCSRFIALIAPSCFRAFVVCVPSMLRAAVKLHVDDARGRLWAARSVRGPRCGAFLATHRQRPCAVAFLTRVQATSWVHDPVLAFYPSSHACVRLPETVQSQPGHVAAVPSLWRSRRATLPNRTRSARESFQREPTPSSRSRPQGPPQS